MSIQHGAMAFIFVISIMTSPFSGANSLENSFNCTEGECVYTPQNTTNIELIISNVRDRLFGGLSPLEYNSYLKSLNGTAISFWHPDLETLNNMKKAILESDRLPSFSAGAGGVVDVQVDVFAIEERGFDNLLYELQPFAAKGTLTNASNEQASGGLLDTGAYILNLAFGNLTSALFKLKLDFSKISNWTSSVNTMTARVYNNEQLSLSDTKSIFTTDNQINREKASVGLSVNGTVLQDAKNKSLVRLVNLNVTYGLATNDSNSLARMLNLYNKTVEVEAGKPLILWSNTVRIDTASTQDNFIFAQGKSSDSVQSKIVIVLTAWPRNLEKSKI